MEQINQKKSINLLENISKGKINRENNEDGMFISDDFVVVVDGVSSKSDFIYKDKKSGRIAMELVLAAFKNISKDANIEEIISVINTSFNEFYATVTFPYEKNKYGLQAMSAIYSKYYHTVWLIGDCQALIDDILYDNPKKSDLILSEMRSLINHIDSMQHQNEVYNTPDVGRNIILPWIEEATIFMNETKTSYGYSVLNGQNIPEPLIKTIKLPCKVNQVILASDGYPILKETLEETETALNKIIKNDPNCINEYKSTKGLLDNQVSFDDRTYMRFEVQ